MTAEAIDRRTRVRRALGGDRSLTVTRAFAIDDIKIRSEADGGDGRTVDAYAAVFLTPTEIWDEDGHYNEQIDPAAFTKSIADRASQIFCVYNHARTLQGTPSDTYSVPIGKPVPGAMRADKRGLFTSTRYNADPESERILEAIRTGSLTGMSFTGVFLRSDPELQGPWSEYGPNKAGDLPLVTRQEIALIEYGPTPIPAYDTAMVLGVRSRETVRLVSPPEVVPTDRAASAVHHTDIVDVTTSPWDEGNELNKMTWPAATDPMADQFAIYDDTDGKQVFNRGDGFLPHHVVGADGKPGAAHGAAVMDGLNKVSALGARFSPDLVAQARDHLHAHALDLGLEQPGNWTGSSGRDADDASERAATDMHDALMHGEHSHAHPAYDGQDGTHEHMHRHAGDAYHDHLHGDVVSATSSAARGDQGTERTQAEPGEDQSAAGPDDDNDDVHNRAAGVDNSSWDASKAWAAGTAADNPAAFFRSICAGRKSGDPATQAAWALPHHYHPGDPPNASGVSAALGRFGQTQGLTNSSAAKAHLEAHSRAIASAKGDGDSDTTSSSSSGRQPAADEATSRIEAGEGTTPPTAQRAEPPEHSASDGDSATSTGSTTVETTTMTAAERNARLAEIRARVLEIDTAHPDGDMPAEVVTELDGLSTEMAAHERTNADAKQRAEFVRQVREGEIGGEQVDNTAAGFGDGNGRSSGVAGMGGQPPQVMTDRMGDIYDFANIHKRALQGGRTLGDLPYVYRDYAMKAVERARYPALRATRDGEFRNLGTEDHQATIERLLHTIDDKGELARRILATGSPVYDRAFGKMLTSQFAQPGMTGLTEEESRALQLGVDSAGGYAVPFQLDPTVILTSNGAINPLRHISRVEPITGKEWDGVTSTGVTVTRAAEGTEAASADAVFVQPNVRTTRVQGFVPFNIELDVSWGALRSSMTALLMDAKDVEEATSFLTGNGTAPNCNGVVGTMGTASLVYTASTATLAIADLYALENAMAPRFRQQSAYLASKTTYNRFRQLFQALASSAFDSWVRPSAGTPATFNGYPAYEASQMSTTITTGSQVLLQGDFREFLIVDRVGMGIELIPHLFGATSRYPTGQRGILAIWFNNSKILAGNAFRLLQTL